jgi:hypothetical protein
MYVSLKYMRETLVELQREIDEFTIVVGDFHTPVQYQTDQKGS